MKNTVKHFAMLSFIALSMNLAAQAQQIESCSNGLLVVETDTVSVEKFMLEVDRMPIDRQLELRKKVMEAMKKEDQPENTQEQ